MKFRFFPTLAAAITVLGFVGLVISSLAHAGAAGDFIFNAAAVCMVAGPLIFLTYVVIGLCVEFLAINKKSRFVNAAFALPLARSTSAANDIALDHWIPEGLRRERKGPLDPVSGRRSGS